MLLLYRFSYADTVHYSAMSQPSFVPQELREHMDQERAGFINNLKTFLRRFPRLYVTLIYVISPWQFIGLSPRKFFKRFNSGAVLLNVGSGVHKFGSNVLNVDIFPYEGVDVVADAQALPFEDNSVDGILCEMLIEHVPHPEKVISEIKRVLKPNGSLYLSTPFVYPFHACPNDFYRWSPMGLRVLCNDFEIECVAPRGGPVSGLIAQLVTCIAIMLSFGSEKIYSVLSVLLLIPFFPFKFLDLIFGRYPTAKHGAAGCYIIVQKKG